MVLRIVDVWGQIPRFHDPQSLVVVIWIRGYGDPSSPLWKNNDD
jgi:hypothetical protein